MKKNGFIATSILYTFFLVFLSLFVALIANYLHNRILLAKIDEKSREILYGINNTKLSDLEVGDHIKFKSDDNLLNSDATWIVVAVENVGSNKKYHFFKEIIPLEHPRFIMQYNSKRKDEFIMKYLNALRILAK